MGSLYLAVSVAVVAALASIAVLRAVRSARESRHASTEGTPPTPLQRLARTSLLSTTAFVVPGLFIVLWSGVDRASAETGARILVTTLALAGIAAGTLPVLIARRSATRNELVLDERDEAILHRAPEIQSWTLLCSVVIWMIVLMEAFWMEGAVPLSWLTVAFWTSIVAWALALPAGIVIGYARNQP